MKSTASPSFWRALRELPERDRLAARRAFELFAQNPAHNSLRFKKLAGHPFWSVRVTLNVRAVGERHDTDTVRWFWIGTHSEFDRLFS